MEEMRALCTMFYLNRRTGQMALRRAYRPRQRGPPCARLCDLRKRSLHNAQARTHGE